MEQAKDTILNNDVVQPTPINEAEILQTMGKEDFAKVQQEMSKGQRILSEVLQEIQKPKEVASDERKDEQQEAKHGDVPEATPEQTDETKKTEPSEQTQKENLIKVKGLKFWGKETDMELDDKTHKDLLQMGLKFQYMEREHGTLQSIVNNMEKAGIDIDLLQEVIKAKSGDVKAAARLMKTFNTDISEVITQFEDIEPIQHKEVQENVTDEYKNLRTTLKNEYADTWQQINEVKKFIPDSVSRKIDTDTQYLQIVAEELTSGRFEKVMPKMLPYLQRQDIQLKVNLNPKEFWHLYASIIESANPKPQTEEKKVVKEPTPSVTKKPQGALTQPDKEFGELTSEQIQKMSKEEFKKFMEKMQKN